MKVDNIFTFENPVHTAESDMGSIRQLRVGDSPMACTKVSLDPSKSMTISLQFGGFVYSFGGEFTATDVDGSVKITTGDILTIDNNNQVTLKNDAEWAANFLILGLH